MKTAAKMKAALEALGWMVIGPKRTPGGFKALAGKGTVFMLVAGETESGVLEDLLGAAEDRERGRSGTSGDRYRVAARAHDRAPAREW